MNIGQAAAAAGVSARMIRHYEAQGLVPRAARRASGYRDYGPAEIERLGFIAKARGLGFPLGDIRQLLSMWDDSERASGEVKALALAHADALRLKAEALATMRAALLELAGRCQGDTHPDCAILSGLAGKEAA